MLIYWFLPMIFFLGIVTSYEDIRFGKLRNKWILATIFYSTLFNLLLISLGHVNLQYITKFLINGFGSLAVGVLIWYANLWTAGDAKLFFAYSLLLPLDIYVSSHSGLVPSLNVLINTFMPVAILLMI